MLPPDTKAVWQYLEENPLLEGFHLIGGTALSLRISHRISEDLDLCSKAVRLPRKRLEILIKQAETDGFSFEENDDPGALAEFEMVEMDLHDYQQDFVVNNKVKVTFFTADNPLSKILSDEHKKGVRIASLKELFRSKAVVSSQRSKSRDWFDLYYLMTFSDFTFGDYVEAFQVAGIPTHWESGISRIVSGKLGANDEGFNHMVKEPPSIEKITEFFKEERDRYEIGRARKKKEG